MTWWLFSGIFFKWGDVLTVESLTHNLNFFLNGNVQSAGLHAGGECVGINKLLKSGLDLTITVKSGQGFLPMPDFQRAKTLSGKWAVRITPKMKSGFLDLAQSPIPS